jgi:hypothetical protein
MSLGRLEKMKIYAYNNGDFQDSHLVGVPFVALINPESYSLESKMNFNDGQGQGTTGTQPRFELKPPEELSFEFLFDNTGIINGIPKPNIAKDLADFKEMLMGYDSQTHEPKFFKLAWGTLLVKGRCTSLTITYKLFNPNGAPIRAVCKATFKGSIEENLRVAIESPFSPDLTHYRLVKKGDTLPLMCYRIYGDSRYYLQVAMANRLTNFRNLQVGDELFFPPIEKTSNT